MHNQNFTSLPDLHGVPVFYPHGTQLIWISQNGEITRPSRETLAAEFALGWFCYAIGAGAQHGLPLILTIILM